MLSSDPTFQNSLEIYQMRLKPVFEHIHQHPDDPLSLAKAAELSHFSKFHFQRIFSALVGESLSSYTNRLRLELAANCLLFSPQTSVTDIAMQYGFSSSANFTRAFKEHFGVTPVGIRNTKKLGKAIDDNPVNIAVNTDALKKVHKLREETYSAADGAQPIKIVDTQTKTLCTLRSTNGYDLSAIYRCWEDLINWGSRNQLADMTSRRFGMGFDNPVFTPKEKCRYDAALVIPDSLVEKVQLPFKVSTMPAGKYAVFQFSGTQEEILHFQISLYTQWMPFSGYEPDNQPLIEHYDQPMPVPTEFNCKNRVIDMQIWLKLRNLRRPNEF